MATKTYAQQLESVQTAIAAIESGELETKRGESAFHGISLADLYKRERQLRRAVAREAGCGSTGQIVIRRRQGRGERGRYR